MPRKKITPEEAEARIEDYLWMRKHGETFERAAVRLGVTEKALERFLRRHGYSVIRAEKDEVAA